MSILLDQPAPELTVSHWVQGGPHSFESLKGRVILVEVFQVNCPGCFLYALPQAIRLHDLYQEKGLIILGLATAFEDYDKNTLENLQALVSRGAVVGETEKALKKTGELVDGKFRWQLPFAVAMDNIIPDKVPITDERILEYAMRLHPDIEQRRPEEQEYISKMVGQYLKQKTMKAETFEHYDLKGTPSSILVDREGILRDVSFGHDDALETMITRLLD